jgi:hypothetical protein
LALAVALAVAEPACAELGPHVPNLDLGFQFRNLDKFEKYDFYLKYERGERGGPGQKDPASIGFHVTKLASGVLTRMEGNGTRHSDVYLVAVPRGQALAAPEKPPGPDWLKNPPAGGLQSEPLKGDGKNGGLGNVHDLTYDVRIEGDKLHADFVESKINAWWTNAFIIAGSVCAACILIPLMLIVLVVVLIMRSRRRSQAKSAE